MTDTDIATPEPNDFEAVWVFAYYPTNGGRISDKDDQMIRSIAKAHGAHDVGSGTLMVPPYERDMQFRTIRGIAERLAATFRKAGYRAEIRDIPPRNREFITS